jgi:hypothetical protein
MSCTAAAITRWPLPPSSSILSWVRRLSSASQGTLPPSASAVEARAITAGAAPLTKQRTTGRPALSTVELNVAISL